MEYISTGKLTRLPGKLARLPKKFEKDLKKGSWHFSHGNPLDGTDYVRRRLENIPPNAIDELWLAAGEGRIQANALECKNAKAFDGDPIEIPAHYWARLKRADDRMTGKAMLSDDNGRVYREVQFPRLDVKELWPRSASSSEIEPAISVEEDKGGRPPDYEGPNEPLDRPILQETEAATPKKRGRKKRGRLLCHYRSPPLGRNERTDFFTPRRVPSGSGKKRLRRRRLAPAARKASEKRLAKQ